MFGCKSGYRSQFQKVSSFLLLFEKLNLLALWIKFVNCKNWKPSKISIICAKHFIDELIKDDKRKKLKWEFLPVPTTHKEKALKHLSVLPCASIIGKAPKIRIFQKDELGNFENDDIVANSLPRTVFRACICFDFAKFSANVFSHVVFRSVQTRLAALFRSLHNVYLLP